MSCSRKIRNGELLELIAWGRAELLRAGIEEAQEECERIWMKLLCCERSAIYLKEHDVALAGARERFLTILEKRTQRVPLAYLLKEADFWQETLLVDERCLIPRPETEILVERVLKALGERSAESFSFLDIGTGSGAIAVAILKACPNARGTLLDVSQDALDVAGENLKRYALDERARIVCGDLLAGFGPGETFDWIVSNPPYLSEADLKEPQEELRFEPRRALDGGKDGMDFYRRIIPDAWRYLKPRGFLAFEVGAGQAGPPMGPARSRGLDAPASQADRVSKWLQEAGYDNIQRFRDYSGVERVIIARNK